MANKQDTDFQIALLHQLSDLAEVICNARPCNPHHTTDRAMEARSEEFERQMKERAQDFEAIYGG